MAGTVNYRSPDPDLLDFVEGFLGGNREALPTEWAGADEFALAKRYPAGDHAIPFLLIQGLFDRHTLPVDTRSFERTLVAAGYSSRLIEITKMRHVETWTNGDAVAALMSFVSGLQK
jgi:pimeloyl-ACP methyl ester carboxylesterase